MKKIMIIIIFMGMFSILCYSQNTVNIKYFGSIDLENYEEYEVNSSFVRGVWYLAEEEQMILLLSSTYYAFCGVDIDTFESFLGSRSKGRFFNSYIKNQFDCN